MHELIERKRVIARTYTDGLSGVAALQLPVERAWATSVYWIPLAELLEATGDADRFESLRARAEVDAEK